jgi:hypothetical protein
MVNFDNETTVATPPGDIVKVVVLERREQVIEALENYHSIEASGVDTGHKKAILKARLMAFWYEVEGMVKRRLSKAKGGEKDPTYEEVKQGIREVEDFDDILTAFEWLNSFVDEMGLTFIDGRPKYDRTNIEDANQKKGM